MSKKTFMAAAITTAFIISLVAGLPVDVAKANFKPLPPPILTVLSPQSEISNQSVALIVEAKVVGISEGYGVDGIKWLNYSLDGQAAIPLDMEFQSMNEGGNVSNGFDGMAYNVYLGNSTLTGLSEGSHNLTIQGLSNFNANLLTTAKFKVSNPSNNPSPTPTLSPTFSPSPIPSQSLSPSTSPTLQLTPSTTDEPSQTFIPTVSSPTQTETTITLEWTKTNITAFGILGEYQVTYAPSANGSYSVAAEITDWNQTSYTVTGLEPNTTYYFIIRYNGMNVIGSNLALSNTLQVSTKQESANENFTPAIIILALVAFAVILVVLVYFKRKGAKRE